MVERQQALRPIGRTLAGCLVLLTPLWLVSGGCATTNSNLAKAPRGVPGQVVATWSKDVEFLPDRYNNGRLTPALCGHIYLVENGQAGPKPVTADGSLVVSLYTEQCKTGPDGMPVPLEVWQITPECMSRVMTRDGFMGWGYTLNLPWNTYKPDISTVRLQVQYVPAKDAKDPLPLFSDSPLVALQHPGSTTAAAAQLTARTSPPPASAPSIAQQATGGRVPAPAPPPSASWPETLQANHTQPAAGMPAGPAVPPPSMPAAPDSTQAVVPVSAVMPPAPAPVSAAPAVAQPAARYPQTLPPVTTPTPPPPTPAAAAPVQSALPMTGTSGSDTSTVDVRSRGNGTAYSAGACSPPQTLAGAAPPAKVGGDGQWARMPVTEPPSEAAHPANHGEAQPLGPSLDGGGQVPTAASGATLPPQGPATSPSPPPPPLPQPPAAPMGDGRAPATTIAPAPNAPMGGQMLSMPGSK
jgi:hypothetical protein